jgi:predicted TIM-barrel fold metal-dependent hydrolase
MRCWNRRQVLTGLGFAVHLAAQGRPFMNRDYIDAHVHVWDRPNARFAYDPHYDVAPASPPSFTPEHLLSIARAAGVRRIVLVQMSYYGTDNSFMLDTMTRYPSVFSGIAIVDPQSPSVGQEMARLASLGIRGLRIVQGDSEADWLKNAPMRALWRLAAETKLAICLLVNPDGLPGLDSMCAEFPDTTVVIDHMARIGMDGVIRQKDVDALCDIARHAQANVKISAFYALGKRRAPFNDLVPVVHALYRAYGPQRLMWASDSPFQVQPPYTYIESLDFVLDRVPFLSPEDKQWMMRRTAENIFF